MQTEKSCGGLVFTRTAEGIRYVVLRQTNGDWGFPKGHTEPGETEIQTAAREIFEEVGLEVTFLEGYREELSYPLLRRPGYTKHCVYFLAQYQDQPLLRQESEVSDVRLLTYEEAMEILSFPESRTLLEKAHEFLGKQEMETP